VEEGTAAEAEDARDRLTVELGVDDHDLACSLREGRAPGTSGGVPRLARPTLHGLVLGGGECH
jgi:hypothetical protein